MACHELAAQHKRVCRPKTKERVAPSSPPLPSKFSRLPLHTRPLPSLELCFLGLHGDMVLESL